MSPRPPPRLPALRSRVALAVEGDNLLWGRSVRHDVVGRVSLSGLIALSVTGRSLAPEDCALLDDLIAALMAVDVRLWPLKVGRVVSSFGHSMPAFVAAQVACASEKIGPLIIGKASQLLLDLEARLGDRVGDPAAIEEDLRRRLDAHERLPGFGAPFRPADERLVALRESIVRRGRQGMRYWQLAERVAEAAMKARDLQANIVLHAGGLFLDLGFRPDEANSVMLALVVPLFIGVAHEGAAEKDAQLRHLPADAVEYVGPPPRVSPRGRGV